MSFRWLFGKNAKAESKHVETRSDLVEAPDGFQDGVEAFAWRILVDAYARILAKQTGQHWLALDRNELIALLTPYHDDLRRDAKALGAAIAQARTEGVQALHAALHRAEGLDHEMVDQAVAYAYSATKARKDGEG